MHFVHTKISIWLMIENAVDQQVTKLYMDGTVRKEKFVNIIIKTKFLADLREIPWQVILGYTIRNDFKITWGCGGALITDRIVVTASHCISRDLLVLNFNLISLN